MVLVALGGCTLVDQNTFDPHARDAPVIPPAPVVAAPIPGPPPLVVITSADPASYTTALRQAVAAARARKPDVTFDVVEVQPPDTVGDVPIGEEAAAVARVIVGAGIQPLRVRLVARPVAGGTPKEVRVYVH